MKTTLAHSSHRIIQHLWSSVHQKLLCIPNIFSPRSQASTSPGCSSFCLIDGTSKVECRNKERGLIPDTVGVVATGLTYLFCTCISGSGGYLSLVSLAIVGILLLCTYSTHLEMHAHPIDDYGIPLYRMIRWVWFTKAWTKNVQHSNFK